MCREKAGTGRPVACGAAARVLSLAHSQVTLQNECAAFVVPLTVIMTVSRYSWSLNCVSWCLLSFTTIKDMFCATKTQVLQGEAQISKLLNAIVEGT